MFSIPDRQYDDYIDTWIDDKADTLVILKKRHLINISSSPIPA